MLFRPLSIALSFIFASLFVNANEPINNASAENLPEQLSDELISRPVLTYQNKKLDKTQNQNLYMVLLEDEPLAIYHAQQYKQSQISSSNLQTKPVASRQKINLNSLNNQNYLKQLNSKRTQVIAELANKLNRSLKVQDNFKYALNGFTTELSSDELQQVKANKEVKRVVKVTARHINSDSGPTLIKAPSIWNGTASSISSQGEGIVVGIIDSGINPFHPSFQAKGGDNYQHVNPLGSGVYLGDCATPAYAHYCNDKLIGIWSHPTITDTYTVSGDDPIGRDYEGHGSHVASIAAGNHIINAPIYTVTGNEAELHFPEISGVAPHANIISYQVCQPDGKCWSNLTALAVEHAIEHGVDVINYSVGGEVESPWDNVDAIAFLSAREAGIHVAVSAGNSGPELKTVDSPANAPWLTSVGAYSHDRSLSASTKTVSFSGGNSQLATIIGQAATSGITAKVVYAGNYGDKDCLTPFAANTFNGEIVLCVRNDIPRVDKGSNVLAGGAGGMILMNDPNDLSTNNLVTDYHVLPAIHIGSTQGQQIINWLKTGSNHTATISGVSLSKDITKAYQMGSFSARGPEPVFGQWLSPSISSPGRDIYAAFTDYQPFTAPEDKAEALYAYLSGTSMSSPHIAGALALIAAVKPNWTPAQAQSALMLSADIVTKKVDGESLVDASILDSGAGAVRIDKAVNSLLIMDINNDEYHDAEPVIGGQPSKLNLPALVSSACPLSCTWQRTVTATASGNWQISYQADTEGLELSVSPEQFSLNTGQSQVLTIAAKISNNLNADYGLGRVFLTANNDPTIRLSMAVSAEFVSGSFPANTHIIADSEIGSANIAGIKTIATNSLQVAALALSPVQQQTFTLSRDDFDNNAFPNVVINNQTYIHSEAFSVAADTKLFVAEITQSTSPDTDLYVGLDTNNNGKLDLISELNNAVCKANSETSLERCVLVNPEAGNYFIAVYNYGDHVNKTGRSDTVSVDYAAIDNLADRISVEFDPVVVANQEANVILTWQGLSEINQKFLTGLQLGLSASSPSDLGIMPIYITRSGQFISASFNKNTVFPNEQLTLEISIDANQINQARQFTLSAQIPSGFSVLSVTEQGSVSGTQVNWNISQGANSAAKTINVVLLAKQVNQDTAQTVQLTYQYLNQNYSHTSPAVTILNLPKALINGSVTYLSQLNSGAMVNLSGAQSSAGNTLLPLSYQWRQVSGNSVSLTNVNTSNIAFNLPQVSAEQQISFELLVNDGRSSATATATITILPEVIDNSPPTSGSSSGSGGGGGSLSWGLLLLMALFSQLRAKINLNRPY